MNDVEIEKTFVRGRDSAKHDYIEVECNKVDEQIRVTAIPETYGVEGAEPAVRIQIRQADGKLRPGPEFASAYLPDVIWALVEVGRKLDESKRSG